jgi:hypothetical protein
MERVQPHDAPLVLTCPICGSECQRVPSVTVVGHVGLKREAAKIDARIKYNAARGKRSSSPR